MLNPTNLPNVSNLRGEVFKTLRREETSGSLMNRQRRKIEQRIEKALLSKTFRSFPYKMLTYFAWDYCTYKKESGIIIVANTKPQVVSFALKKDVSISIFMLLHSLYHQGSLILIFIILLNRKTSTQWLSKVLVHKEAGSLPKNCQNNPGSCFEAYFATFANGI